MSTKTTTKPATEVSHEEHVSRRYTKAVTGMVRFPVDEEKYTSCGAGMFVKLVVVDPHDLPSSPWGICVGAQVTDLRSGTFAGDDQARLPTLDLDARLPAEELLKNLDESEAAQTALELSHFPGQATEDAPWSSLSRPYLCTMVMGVTGWCGFDTQTQEYWRCTFDDLNEQGKAVYEAVAKSYPGAKIHLLTFLDT